MIEIVSLARRGAGCQLELEWSTEGKQKKIFLAIDEEAYEELMRIDPMAAEKARLSIHMKWDPFRKQRYGTIIKQSQSFRTPHYFFCSDALAEQLENLDAHDGHDVFEVLDAHVVFDEHDAHDVHDDIIKPGAPITASKPLKGRRPVLAALWRMQKPLLRLFVLIAVFLILFLEIDVQYLIDDADALSQQRLKEELTASVDWDGLAMASHELDQTVQLASVGAKPDEPASTNATSAATTNVESISLDGDEPVYSLPAGYVALTFDDGPSIYTEEIVDLLVENEVAGTFLFVGNNVKRHADAVIYASNHGMSIGNHSWNHSQLTVSNTEDNTNNMMRASAAITQLTEVPVTVFRPPYGAMNDELKETVKKLGMKLLLWNRDPEDWQADTKEEILKYFKETDPSGGIYVMHEKKLTVESLPVIIDYLKKQKLKFALLK